jgi:uncharacterized protein with PQ loop repeat
MFTLSVFIGWIGVALSVFVTLPQIVKSIKVKSTQGVSLRTYQLLFLMVLCYLIRAIEINELIFIASNGVTLAATTVMLFLFKLYPESKNE